MTNFPNGLSSYGVPILGGGGIPATLGNVFFVDYRNGSDNNSGKTKDNALKTLSTAYGKATSNNNDLIIIDGDSTVTETAMITWSKNRVHVVGVNGVPGHYGQGAKVSIGVTTAATDIALLKVTGVRNTFSNIKFMSSNTVAEGLYCVAEGGEFTRYHNCEFYKSTDLDDAGASELLLNGDSAMFYNCTIGSTANETGNIRANVLCTATLSGKKLRDCYFENCLFFAKADDTDKVFIYGANATDVERMLTFKGCTFFNNPLSAGTPAAAIAFGAAQTEGAVFCDTNTACVDCSVMGTTGQNIFVMQQDGATYATGGLAAQA